MKIQFSELFPREYDKLIDAYRNIRSILESSIHIDDSDLACDILYLKLVKIEKTPSSISFNDIQANSICLKQEIYEYFTNGAIGFTLAKIMRLLPDIWGNIQQHVNDYMAFSHGFSFEPISKYMLSDRFKSFREIAKKCRIDNL